MRTTSESFSVGDEEIKLLNF